MPRTILIVDDNMINRQMMKHTLCGEYDVIEAVNGVEALDVIYREHETLAAVLLDIVMPEMDGYEVLHRVRDDVQYAQIPIIMVTGSEDEESRVKALSLGANDFILKPFNPEIMRHCLKNNIALRETESLLNAIQRDKLTGLFCRDAFFGKVSAMVAEQEPGYYILSSFDIDNFKLINDQFGTLEGDRILREIGRVVNEDMEAVGGVGGRISADNFAVLLPDAEKQLSITRLIEENRNAFSDKQAFTFSVGRYHITDTSLPASAIYDRAYIAKQSVKGQYRDHIAYFNDTMLDKLVRNQQIIAEMDTAVAERQFEVWFQPQHNHATGALVGAEALVRWRHPVRGLISPGDFIPVFEQNGFIYELDKYVWEETCRLLRKWMDEGRNSLPVSVNISRYDIFRPDIIDVLLGLLEKYTIPVDMLRLEITESAFAQSTDVIVNIVKQLIDKGFTLEIDDFGSGYSSLNTLKSVPAQVLKLDMRFLEADDGSQRTGNILESIVRMAKWLGMSVIAEGVEEKPHADYLTSIGCSYMQGFLYARPMPASEYEVYCNNINKEERLLTMETVSNLDNNLFWDPQSMDTLIFNSYVGAACIFEHYEGNVDLLRVNAKFTAILGSGSMSVADVLNLDWLSCISPKSLVAVRDILRKSKETGEEYTSEYEFLNIPGGPPKTCLRATMRVIATAGKRSLVYCFCENVTAQREAEETARSAEQKIKNSSAQLQTMMNDMPGGFVRLRVESDQTLTAVYYNEGYLRLIGMERDELEESSLEGPLAGVHPDDLPVVQKAIKQILKDGQAHSSRYRLRHGKGGYVWLSIFGRVTRDAAGGTYLNIYYTDASDQVKEEELQKDLLDNLPGGAGLIEYDGSKLSVIYLNKSYWDLVGREAADYSSISALGAVYPNDMILITQEINSAIRQHRDMICDFRLKHEKKGYFPVRLVGRIVPQANGNYYIFATFASISHEEMSLQAMLPVALQGVMDSSSELSFVKDRNLRFISCSRTMARLVGKDSGKDLLGKTSDEFFPEDLAQTFYDYDRAILKTGRSFVDIHILFPAEDGIRHLLFSKYPLLDGEGNVLGIYGSGRDVTETRNTESRLEMLTNSIPGGLAVFEGRANALDQTKLTYFSDGFCRLFGYTRKEYEAITAGNALAIVAPEDVSKMEKRIRDLVFDGIPMDLIYRAKVADGTTKSFNIKAVMGEPNGENKTVCAVFFDVTEQENTLEKLRISEEISRLAILQSKTMVCQYDIASRRLMVPENVNPIFGMNPVEEDIPYKAVREGKLSTDTAEAYLAFYESILDGKPEAEVRFRQSSSQGWRWIEAHATTIFSDSGQPDTAVISFFDVTENVERDVAYKKWKRSFSDRAPESYAFFHCNISRDIVLDAVEGLLVPDEGTVHSSCFSERTNDYVNRCVFSGDRGRFLAAMDRDIQLMRYSQGRKSDSLEYREIMPGGRTRWLRLTVDLMDSPSSDLEAHVLFENIDEAKRIELEIIERAERDPLTGVYNRSTFEQKVDQVIRESDSHARHALLMLDIDGFKLVNDVFGHAAGDQLLIDIADLLRKGSRRNDLVGRLGGDEFVLFLSDISNEEAAARKAGQICDLTRKALSLEVQVSGSVGIALYPQNGMDFETLYKKADDTLYYVKDTGKDNCAFFRGEKGTKEDTSEKVWGENGSAETGSQTKKRRMLIVDDSKVDHEMLANIFRNDYKIEKAMDGRSALIKLHHFGSAISVVLLDLIMPGMDGFAVLENMQKGNETRSIPVVIVSSTEDRETNLRAIRAGAADFVTKPVDPDILWIRVQSAVSKAENERLRAQNSFLVMRDSETNSYKTVLERTGTLVVAHDWGTGSFSYNPSALSRYLAGAFDGRSFWHILMADRTTDPRTVQAIQTMEHKLASDRDRTQDSITAGMRTPSGETHDFRVNIYKQTNEYNLTDKMIITLNDLGDGKSE